MKKINLEDINSALANNDIENALVILMIMIKNSGDGVAHFCKNQNLPRESLYKSFRNDGDPKISTIMRVLNGLNCTLNIVPLEKQVSKQPSNYSLGDNHPFVLPFWDYDNNKSISPYRITSKSRRPINWKCTSHEPIYKWKENPVSLIRRFTSKISKNLEWIKINKDAVEYVCPLCSKC